MKPMRLMLKAGERLFINGAVVRFERRASVEILNDVEFLLETHVLQAHETTTPLRQLYFVVQLMLIDPSTAKETRGVFTHLISSLMTSFSNEEVLAGLRSVSHFISEKQCYEAMKTIRGLYAIEEKILASDDEAAAELRAAHFAAAGKTSTQFCAA